MPQIDLITGFLGAGKTTFIKDYAKFMLDQQVQLGTGYLIPFVQRELYPEQPLNIYMEMTAQPSARYLLFGALTARAGLIKEKYPGMKARLYTQLDATDAEMQAFYQRCGLQMDDAEDLFFPFGPGNTKHRQYQ